MKQIEHALADWMILQLADSAFPAGGFAHSGGLESAWQLGAIRDAGSLAPYLDAQILQISRGLLPFVKAAHVKPQQLVSIDATCHAYVNNPVTRRASIAQGQAFALATAKAFGGEECLKLAALVRRREIYGHWSPIFGALMAALQLSDDATTRLFLFVNVRGLISAAVRLGIVGPLEGQAIQFAALRRADICAIDTEPAQASPILDLWQGVQDRLYSRLFQS
jgi:urease accessory protein